MANSNEMILGLNKHIFGNTFITGATGLLGSEFLSQLLHFQECSKIICLVRDHIPLSRFYSEKLSEKVVLVRGDLKDLALLDRIMNEYEINTIFHMAAQTLVGQANNRPIETFDVNIRGTWNLLEAARCNLKTVSLTMVASSDKAYGNLRGEQYTEESPLVGEHPYDVSKSCADLIAQSYSHTYGMAIGITRCGNFFGPGDLNESRVFPSTILSAMRGQAPKIRSNGKYIRDYIYVSDGAAAYRHLAKKIIKKEAPAEAYNFSYGLKCSVLDVVEKILAVMGSDLQPQILNIASNEIPIQSLDSTKAINLLQWRPQFGFDEGVAKTVDWYQKEFKSGALL